MTLHFGRYKVGTTLNLSQFPNTLLRTADKAITELAQQDPELKRLFERASSVVGTSQTTAAEIILATNEFQDIADPKKFACYAG